MKKFIITLCILASATYCVANQNENERGAKPGMGEPPKEAISICEGKNEGDTCSMTTPRGDTLEGTCKTTPDDKYFACMPADMKNKRPH